MLKICSVCKIAKPGNHFHNSKRFKGGKVGNCKSCQKERNKKHYEENKDAYLTRSAAQRVEQLQQFKDWKATLSCIACGEAEITCLEFHHKDPNVKEFLISDYRRFNTPKWLEEVKKCVCLCANCHRKVHAGVLVLPDKP